MPRAAVTLPIQDLPLDHPNMRDILALIDCPNAVSVRREVRVGAGTCYWAARDISQQWNGSPRLGWMLEWLPGLYLSAMHHAVIDLGDFWVDVSNPAEGRSGGYTTFAPDERFQPDLRWPVEVQTKYFPLTDDEDVIEAINAYRENNSLSVKRHREFSDAPGANWHPLQGWSFPEAPALLREFDEGIDATYDRLHTAREKILKRYFA